MKRNLSIFSLLGGAVLLGCLILSAVLLSIQFHQAKAQAERDRDSAFALSRALMQAVLDSHLERLETQLRHLVAQDELALNGARISFEQAQQGLQQLDAQGQTRLFDRLVLASSDGSRCQEHGDIFLRNDCRSLVSQFNEPLYRWHLFTNNGSSRQVGLSLRHPLSDPGNGRVSSYLYAATILSDNFALLNRVNGALDGYQLTLALAYEGTILASNKRLSPAQRLAIDAALAEPQQVVRQQELFARSSYVQLDNDVSPVQLVTLLPADSYDLLLGHTARYAITALVIGTLLAILISLAAVKLTLQPLINLLHYTRAPDSTQPPQPGLVTEINQINAIVARQVRELSESQRTLQRYSAELEATHAEVQQSNAALHQRSQELEQSNQRLEQLMGKNKALLHQLFHLQEEERKHLAEELHDALGQNLAAIRTEIHMNLQRLEQDDPNRGGLLLIDQQVQEMYDVVYNRIISLRPLSLNDLGLSEAIRHMPLLRHLREQGCQVELDLPQLPRLGGSIEINLFRIAQEALSNILRHAAASQVAVSLQFNDGRLLLLVRDNGKGFDLKRQEQQAGFGISGMRERCHAINGTLQLDSSSHGTALLAEVPLSSEALLSQPVA